MVFLLICYRLDCYWCFTQWEKNGGIEWEDSDVFFFDPGGAKATDDYILPGLDDFSDARFADRVFAGGKFSG